VAPSLTPTLPTTNPTATFTPTHLNAHRAAHPNDRVEYHTFGVNTGGSDVIPHQLIRTSDDRLYFFGYAGNASNALKVYWTPSAGLPASAGNFSVRQR